MKSLLWVSLVAFAIVIGQGESFRLPPQFWMTSFQPDRRINAVVPEDPQSDPAMYNLIPDEQLIQLIETLENDYKRDKLTTAPKGIIIRVI